MAESRAPVINSIRGDDSLDQRNLPAVRFLFRTKSLLVQDNCARAKVPVPEGLMSRYAVKAQMLASILDADGEVRGWLSAHYCPGTQVAQARPGRDRASRRGCLPRAGRLRSGGRLTGEPPLEGGARLLRQLLGFTMHGSLQGAGRFAHDRGITLADVRIQPGAGSADGDRGEHDISVVHRRGNGGNAGLAFAIALGPSLLEGLRIASKNAAGRPAVEWQERADGNRCPQFLDRFHRDDDHPAVASPDVQLRGLAGFRCQLAQHRRREQAWVEGGHPYARDQLARLVPAQESVRLQCLDQAVHGRLGQTASTDEFVDRDEVGIPHDVQQLDCFVEDADSRV
jgi:hypothetical protein